MSKIQDLPEPDYSLWTLEERVKKIRELLKKSENIFLVDHAKIRMNERNITMPQIIDTLRSGKGEEGIPLIDSYENVRTVFTRHSAGTKVKAVVVIKKNILLVVTVI